MNQTNNKVANEKAPAEEYIKYLESMVEYTRYLYEEEKQRSERFHLAVKTYVVFVGATIAGLVTGSKWLGVSPAGILSSSALSLIEILVEATVVISLLLLSVSFVFSVLVIKGWKIERLCDAQLFSLQSSFKANNVDLLETIVSNFAVAASRNAIVNDNRGKLLAWASLFYRIALLFILFGAISVLWL